MEHYKDLRQKREALKLSQARLAQMLGVHVSTLKLWEYGAGKPNEENLAKLMAILEGVGDELDKDEDGLSGRSKGAFSCPEPTEK